LISATHGRLPNWHHALADAADSTYTCFS
jgi:hypothetical protein